MRKAFLSICFILVSISCFARLGETVNELISRYGPPVKTEVYDVWVCTYLTDALSEKDARCEQEIVKVPHHMYEFRVNNIKICADTDSSDVCQIIYFGQIDRKYSGDFTLDEITELCEKNSQGFKWSEFVTIKGPYGDMVDITERSDGGLAKMTQNGFTIQSGALLQYSQKVIEAKSRKAKKESKNLKSF